MVDTYCLAADRGQISATKGLPTPLDQHQPPVPHSSTHMSGHDLPANKHLQDLARYDVQTMASGVAEMQLTGAVDEETTMCLREQLIHSRCTESRHVLSCALSADRCMSAVCLCWCMCKKRSTATSLPVTFRSHSSGTIPCSLQGRLYVVLCLTHRQ